VRQTMHRIYLRLHTMNSHKTRYHWCNSIYASGGVYSNHIQKKHPEDAHQTFSPLVCQQPDVTDFQPEPEQENTGSESTSIPIQDPEPEYSVLSDADIDPAELARIQGLYVDWEPLNDNVEEEYDSDMEPLVEMSASTNHKDDTKPYTADVTRWLPARYRLAPLFEIVHSRSSDPWNIIIFIPSAMLEITS